VAKSGQVKIPLADLMVTAQAKAAERARDGTI
jgi:hypothetical protein